MLKAMAFPLSLLGQRLRQEDRGASAVEYGLLIILIAFVIIGAVTLLGSTLNSMYQVVASAL